jgi:hypothetical protein
MRQNVPHLAWVVGEKLLSHSDYQFSIRDSLFKLSSVYNIQKIGQASWFSNYKNETWLGHFDLIVVVASLFDELDMSIASLPKTVVTKRKAFQRRACFMVLFSFIKGVF